MNVLHGGEGNDSLHHHLNTSEGAVDTMFGEDGDDYFTLDGDGFVQAYGGAGNDEFDLWYGETGQSIVTGGSGADIFGLDVWGGTGTISGADIIADFEDGVDKINLIEFSNGYHYDGLSFEDYATLFNDGNNCVIFSKVSNHILAVVQNGAGLISEADFV